MIPQAHAGLYDILCEGESDMLDGEVDDAVLLTVDEIAPWYANSNANTKRCKNDGKEGNMGRRSSTK